MKRIKNLQRRVKIGGSLILAGWVFYLAQNAYFGWNMKTMSRAEAICDGICGGLWALGVILGWHAIIFDNWSFWKLKNRISCAWQVLFSPGYQVYYRNSKGEHIHYCNITIGEADKVSKYLSETTSDAIEQERALETFNQILNNK